MQQSVNFLKALPKSTSRLPPFIMGLVLLATVAVLTLISMITGLSHYQAYKSLDEAHKSLVIAQQAYNKIAKDYPLLASDIPFVNRVKDLEDKFQAQKTKLDSLQHLINRRGFSEYLRDLAQKTPNTLWLNQIQINHDSGSVTLNGYSTSPDAIPEFMSNLLEADAFKQEAFNLFFVKTIKNHPYLKFSIATKDLGSKEENIIEQTAPATKKPKE